MGRKHDLALRACSAIHWRLRSPSSIAPTTIPSSAPTRSTQWRSRRGESGEWSSASATHESLSVTERTRRKQPQRIA